MDILLYSIPSFIVVLGVLVFFHELGHFLVAKLFGVKVLKFSLGFGYKLIGKKIGETEYLISTVPLGGYVKMLGENDDETEPISPDEAERAFNNKNVFKRIAIVAAGPIFNLVLALFMFCGLFLIRGNPVLTTEIGKVREGSPAHKAGLLKGDVIVSVRDKEIETWSELKDLVKDQAGNQLVIIVKRSDEFLSMTVIPEASVVKNIFGEDVQSALIGIEASGNFETMELGPFQAIKQSFNRTWEITELTVMTVVKLFQGVVPLKTLGGPILIGQMTGQLAKESFIYLIPLTAVISINLAILNLLPIPILDGGVIIFLLFELFIGKPLSLRTRELTQKVGLFLLISLMVFVFYNDILRLLE
jgi:regulator of sigma E protease